MKAERKKRTTLLLAIFTLWFLLFSGGAVAGEIQWQGYEKGMAMAKAQGKKIFLYFHADWCTYCKKMKKGTFRDNAVASYLNENFISISIDSDRKKNLAGSYGVRGLPTLWLLKEDHSKLSSLPGYVDARRLLTILKYVHTESYEKMSFNAFVKTL